MIERVSEITLSKDNTGKHRISFKCTSELYGVTDAGGYAEDALRLGFVPLGDGCDYKLTDEEGIEIEKFLDNMPDNKKYNYYQEQLDRLVTTDCLSIKIRGENGETKWMTLNKESVPKVIEFLVRKLCDE